MNSKHAEIHALIDKDNTLDSLGNHIQNIEWHDKALDIDPNKFDALNGKKQALIDLNNQARTLRSSLSSSNQTKAAP